MAPSSSYSSCTSLPAAVYALDIDALVLELFDSYCLAIAANTAASLAPMRIHYLRSLTLNLVHQTLAVQHPYPTADDIFNVFVRVTSYLGICPSA